MGFFGNRFHREGRDIPLPEGGFRRYAALFFTNFWKLVTLNLLFLLFSVPIVTLPAALCGLNRVCMLLIRNGYCFLWGDFWEEFRKSFLRSLGPGLQFLLMLFGGYYFMSLGLTNAALPLWSVVFWALGIGLSVAGLCWGSYFFALVSLLDQDNRGVKKNAWLLCMLRPSRALGVLCLLGVSAEVFALLMPVSIPVFLLIGASIPQFTLCFLVYELAERYILA